MSYRKQHAVNADSNWKANSPSLNPEFEHFSSSVYKSYKTEFSSLIVLTHCILEMHRGYRQKVQTQIRCHIIWHLIRASTILYNVQQISTENILINITQQTLNRKNDSSNIYCMTLLTKYEMGYTMKPVETVSSVCYLLQTECEES